MQTPENPSSSDIRDALIQLRDETEAILRTLSQHIKNLSDKSMPFLGLALILRSSGRTIMRPDQTNLTAANAGDIASIFFKRRRQGFVAAETIC